MERSTPQAGNYPGEAERGGDLGGSTSEDDGADDQGEVRQEGHRGYEPSGMPDFSPKAEFSLFYFIKNVWYVF